jgi:hypothetical protein
MGKASGEITVLSNFTDYISRLKFTNENFI